MEPKPFNVPLLLISTIATLAITFLGFTLKPRDFPGNVLAEVAGIFASIIIATLVIDRYTALHRANQWARVRDLTYRAIASNICDLALDAFMFFPLRDNRPRRKIGVGRLQPSPDTENGLDELVTQLRKLSKNDNRDETLSELSVEFYDEIKWILNHIQNVLIPRIIQSSTDQSVIDALIEFDYARQELHHAASNYKRIGANNVFPKVINLLAKSKLLYGELCKHWVVERQ